MGNFCRQKKKVWVIQIEGNDSDMAYGCGFTVVGNRILTCASLFTSYKVIRARRLDQEDFTHVMEVAYMRPRWDIAMLKFKNEPAECVCGDIADSGKLEAGELLYSIAHPSDFVGSFMMGLTGFACVDDVSPSIFKKNSTCADYISTACHITPNYRVMGDVWNASSLSMIGKKDAIFAGKLNPFIPIIQCAGIIFFKGCEGGPVFTKNGDIVGMLTTNCHGFAVAIHSSALKEFIARASENDELDELEKPSKKSKK